MGRAMEKTRSIYLATSFGAPLLIVAIVLLVRSISSDWAILLAVLSFPIYAACQIAFFVGLYFFKCRNCGGKYFVVGGLPSYFRRGCAHCGKVD